MFQNISFTHVQKLQRGDILTTNKILFQNLKQFWSYKKHYSRGDTHSSPPTWTLKSLRYKFKSGAQRFRQWYAFKYTKPK